MGWHKTPGSSNVAGFGWEAGLLTVEFKGGGTYEARVPESVYLDMQGTPSVGSYVARHLKGKLVKV